MAWMEEAGWLQEGEAANVSASARAMADAHELKGDPEILVLNLGEGWRSIAKAVLKKYPTARVVAWGWTGEDSHGRYITNT